MEDVKMSICVGFQDWELFNFFSEAKEKFNNCIFVWISWISLDHLLFGCSPLVLLGTCRCSLSQMPLTNSPSLIDSVLYIWLSRFPCWTPVWVNAENTFFWKSKIYVSMNTIYTRTPTCFLTVGCRLPCVHIWFQWSIVDLFWNFLHCPKLYFLRSVSSVVGAARQNCLHSNLSPK